MLCVRQSLDSLGMSRDIIKKIQSTTVGLLKVEAREEKVDHVKHGPN